MSHTRGVCIDPHGYDAGKKIKGKKRHILVDTLGLMLHAIVHPADIQDRDGGILVMATLFGMFPFLKTLFADGGYQGPQFAKAVAKVLPHLNVEIVKRSDRVKGFVVLPQRWIVGVSSQRARCHVGESPTEAKRLRLRSKGGAVARKQDGGALRQHARKECARSIRLQRTVNADVASLHVLYPVAETVDNARRQQGPTK
jgi:transposase